MDLHRSVGGQAKVAAEGNRADQQGGTGVGEDAVDAPASVRSWAEALGQVAPARKGESGRGRRWEGVLVEVAGQEDRGLAKRGRSLKRSHHQGNAISRRGSRPVGWGVDDKGMEGAIPKELKVSGPRAKARGQVEGREPGGDPADRRPDVARVTMPKDMGPRPPQERR